MLVDLDIYAALRFESQGFIGRWAADPREMHFVARAQRQSDLCFGYLVRVAGSNLANPGICGCGLMKDLLGLVPRGASCDAI